MFMIETIQLAEYVMTKYPQDKISDTPEITSIPHNTTFEELKNYHAQLH